MDLRSEVVEALNVDVFQVLDNPSLREEILKHVIFGKDKMDRKAACTLRLVGKNWNESVVRILWQAHEHLFQVRCDPIQAVDPFVSTFAASTEILGSVAPLAILNFGGLCHPENLESFSNYLTCCGDGLIQLGLQLTENGRRFKVGTKMEAGLQHWALPCLRRLDITLVLDFPNWRSRSDGQEQVAVEDDDKVSTFLLKSVLRTATSLSELRLNISGPYRVPPKRPQFTVFDSVVLPPSLTKITTCITGVTQHLEMMARSPLPNLTWLAIHVGSGPFSDGLIIPILENLRASLKTLRLGGNDYDGRPGTHHVVRFPVMEQLVELSMDGVNVEPELGYDQSLEKYFPRLATLQLPTQTFDNFQKWVGSSPLAGITSLRLLVEQNWKASLTTEAMQRVHFVFPNLRKLDVTMSGEDFSGLEYIFRELRQLTELEINVTCYVERITSSDIWDSLLTGVPVEVITVSRAEPNFWEKNDVHLEDENIASIKNLSELNKFSLSIGVGGRLSPIPHPSISDFVFNCALLKMPKLTELHLGIRCSYNVSQEMTVTWRNNGRSLTFH